MKRTMIALLLLALTACGSGSTGETPSAPPQAAKLVVTSATPVHGIDCWIYTEDTTPLQIQVGSLGAVRYDATEQGWHVAFVSPEPLNGLPIVNLPATYYLKIVKVVGVRGAEITDFNWSI